MRTTRTALPSFWAVVLVCLLMIGLAEGAVRLREHRLPTPSETYGGRGLVREAEQVRADDLPSDILFVGNSMVRRDVNVEVIEDAMESVDQAHNAGVAGAATTVVQRWLLEEMLPRLDSPRVVWGVSRYDFDGLEPDRGIDFYNAQRDTRVGVLGVIDRVLADAFSLSRHRESLRNPSMWGALVGFGPANGQPIGPRANTDRLLSPRNPFSGKRVRSAWDLFLGQLGSFTRNRFSIGEVEAAAFRETLTELLAAEVEVVVLVMPVASSFYAGLLDGMGTHRTLIEYVETVTTELGIRLIDYSFAHPDEDFRDDVHLNGEPAVRFSQRLAEDLTRLGW